MFKCNCGKKVAVLRYVAGNKTCDYCNPQNLSGKFLRRVMGDRQEHEKDILQPRNKDGTINKDYVEVYGQPKPYESFKKRK